MKASAALALGLWIGAVAGLVVGALYFRYGATVATLPAGTETPAAELRRLKQENARLLAETQRLKQTLASLQREWAVEPTPTPTESLPTATEPSPSAPRRVPFRREAEPPAAEAAVAAATGDSLRRLEQEALENREEALQQLASLAGADGAAALMRVWKSGRLTLTNQIRATRLLGAVIEANRAAEEWLQALASAERETDGRLLTAAAQGIANPAALTDPGTFRGRIDFEGRLRCLDWLLDQNKDPQLDEVLNQARDELLLHWAQAESAAMPKR